MSRIFSPETDLYIVHRQDAAKGYMSPDAQRKKPHFHNQCEMIMVADGSAHFHVAGREYALEAGDILCISNMENHYIMSHSAGYDRYAVRFSVEALTSLIHDPLLLSIFKQRPQGFCHQYTCTQEEKRHYIHMLGMMTREYGERNPYWEYLMASGLRNILIHMFRNRPEAFPGSREQTGQNLIFDVQNYIESHLHEPLTLESVASRFYINKFHLSHIFSSITGYTFKRYVVTARLAKAKDLLLHTDNEVQQIAVMAGFSGASNFIRVFRTYEGISPLQYRNRAKEKNEA